MDRRLGADAFARSILYCIALLIALSASFTAYVWAEKAIDHANEVRGQTTRLADELRQSSDDLTKMIRAHVVTGDPAYVRYFHVILDIRNGDKPRPSHYDRIYWDFVIAGEPMPAGEGRQAALLDRLQEAGFAPAEAAKIGEAKAKSDALTALEFEAMALIAAGGPENREKALQLVFGERYLKAKAEIMHPIDDFLAMIDQRTAGEVAYTVRRALLFRYVSIAFGLALIAMLVHAWGTLRTVIGGSPAEVHRQIAAIGRGDFTGEIRVPAGREDSVMGWLAETKAKLTAMATAKQLAESRLREDEQKLRSLFELSPLGIALTDLSGRFLEFNLAFQRITGYDADELRSLDHWALTPRKYEAEQARQMELLTRHGQYGPYEKEYRRKDGSLVPLCLNGVLIKGIDGQPYIWSIVEDISERLSREEQLARSNAELEQFAYVASHDLQTPLRNIVSYSQMLARRYKGQLDADADDFIGFIVDNGKHMSSMIGDLLQFSRVGHQGALGPVDCREVFEHTLANVKDLVAEAGATVSAGPLPVVMGDAGQLMSLFQNLIGNALKYRHPERPPVVEITAEADEGGWRFLVKDNGVGIEPQYHEKVFEMFQRLDPAAYPEGTGIGLAICRRILHRLGGRIEVAASSPEGTTFAFTLKGA